MESPPLTPTSTDAPPRRHFLAACCATITGGLAVLLPVITGGVFAVDPLLRKRPTFDGADSQGFLPVGPASTLPADGTPVRFALQADKLDAWNRFADQPVGVIYVRQIGDNVIAFTDVCPHLGCKIELKDGSFLCPCHHATFGLDGAATNKVPPRGLDTLDVKVVDGQIWVKFEQFLQGRATKEVAS